MKINFTKKQFKTLMELVYMGNWVANGYRIDRLKEYEEGEELILANAKEFGFPEYADDSKVGDGKFYPTMAFMEKTSVHELIDEYKEESFWDELIDRMSLTEFHRRHTQKEIEAMTEDKRRKELYELEEKYGKEFETNGLENMKFLNI